tara:strand:+ start:28 stop:276 length:249 start_codon:yes stop_codon:yes gene_type:complete
MNSKYNNYDQFEIVDGLVTKATYFPAGSIITIECTEYNEDFKFKNQVVKWFDYYLTDNFGRVLEVDEEELTTLIEKGKIQSC